MTINYFLDERSIASKKNEAAPAFRMFAVIDDKYYWAIEWTADAVTRQPEITDMNAGFISVFVKEACSKLKEISPEELRTRFGTFTDYIVRCVSGFRSCLLWVSPDSTASGIGWSIPKIELE